jgi:ankyrin repeat protein
MYSAMAGHDNCLKLLLKKHAHLSARDSNGQTALHWAAVSVSIEMFTSIYSIRSSCQCILVIQYMINITIACAILSHYRYYTISISQGNLGCLKLLIAQMPNPVVKDSDGRYDTLFRICPQYHVIPCHVQHSTSPGYQPGKL